MDNNILKLIGVGVVAYYFLKNKETKKTEVAPVSPDVIRPVTSTPVTTPVTTTPVTTTPDTTTPDTTTPVTITGCQDQSATNFNPSATAPCPSVRRTGITRGFDGEVDGNEGLFINSDY